MTKKEKIYKLELNKKQLEVVQQALEFYSRFAAGQLDYFPPAIEGYLLTKWRGDEFSKRRIRWEKGLMVAKNAMFDLVPNAHMSIGSDELIEEAKIAYDIYRPILEKFAMEEGYKGWSVYKSPGLSYSKEGRINVKN